MSKTLDLLQAAQEKTKGKYSILMSKAEPYSGEASKTKQQYNVFENGLNEKPEKPQEISINKFVFIIVLAFCFLSFCSALYMRFYLTSELNQEKTVLIARLDSIEQLMDKSQALGSGLKEDVRAGNERVEKTEVEISGLKEALASQKFAIENLSKAKNNLFNRVSELEAQKVSLTQGE